MNEGMKLKKIDAHTHLATQANSYMMSLEDRETYDRIMGINQNILLTNARDPMCSMKMQPYQLYNEDAARICQKYPDKYSWLCNLIPDGTERTNETLKKCKDMGARGVGEFTTRLSFRSSVMYSFFSWCSELQLPFLFHMAPEDTGLNYGVIDEPGLPGLEYILKEFPDLVMVAHSQPIWYEISVHSGSTSPKERNSYLFGAVKPGRLVELMEKYQNLYLDLSARSATSALLRDPEFSVDFIEQFADRLIFGTDAVAITDVMALGPWMEIMLLSNQLSEETYRKIMRENAVKVFGLEK